MAKGTDAQTGPRDVFVGRQREIATLQAAFAQAVSGNGRLMLLAGEAGIGKSRLAEAVAAHARTQGAAVHSGWCWEDDGAPAFWPWIQVIRSYLRTSDASTLLSHMGSGAGELAQLVPDVRVRLPGLPAPPALEPAQARFRQFASVAAFLKNAAGDQPLVLILEDLHWADAPSLQLLQFLVQDLDGARLLVIATYCDDEVDNTRAPSDLLATLVRQRRVDRLRLDGMTENDVARYLELTLGECPAPSVVARLHSDTNGNAFFVAELARLLVRNPKECVASPLPHDVREVIVRRLSRVSNACRSVLATAAVIGPEFDLNVLERCGTVACALEVLSEASVARLITAVEEVPGRYRFCHALIRHTLYSGLPLASRVRLHGQIAEALEALCGANPLARVDELAHHFLQAVPEGGVGKAIDYAAQAGERATALLAYEDAAAHLTRALRTLEVWKPSDAARHCELLLALGWAQMRAGESGAVCDGTFQCAAAVARRLRAPELLARAALGFGARKSPLDASNESLLQQLREALAALGPGDSALRARLLSRLALAVCVPDPRAESTALSEDAVRVGRRVGDPATLAFALFSRHAALAGPANVEERLSIATEIVRLAEQVGDREMGMAGRVYGITDALELGDIATVRREIVAYARLAHDQRQPFFQSCAESLRAMQALLEGRFADAEQLATQALNLAQRSDDRGAFQAFLAPMCLSYWERGALAQLEGFVQGTVEQFPVVPGVRAVLATFYAEQGREDEARALLDHLARDEFRTLPQDGSWLFYLALLAEACVVLRDLGRAATLYDLLNPYGRSVIVGVGGNLCLGSASYVLGRLAALLRRHTTARQHLHDALAMNTALGAPPWIAYTQHAYAHVLLAGGDPGDREAALSLLAQALWTAERLGIQRLRRQILAVQQQAGVATMERTARSASQQAEPTLPVQNGVLRQEGEYWAIAYNGSTFRLRNSVGLRYLLQLLRHPGREFLATDLVAGFPDHQPYTAATGDAEAILDPQARSAYTRRLVDLRAALEEARAFNDSERMSRTQAEIDFLAEELARAVGIGGRYRKPAHVERARVSTTRAIKATVMKITAHDAALGRYLATTVKTGTFCSYTPDPRIPVSWTL